MTPDPLSSWHYDEPRDPWSPKLNPRGSSRVAALIAATDRYCQKRIHYIRGQPAKFVRWIPPFVSTPRFDNMTPDEQRAQHARESLALLCLENELVCQKVRGA